MSPINKVSPSGSLPDARPAGSPPSRAAQRSLVKTHQQIANPDSPTATGALLDLNQSRVLTEAGANVLRAENKMLGSLLDMFS